MKKGPRALREGHVEIGGLSAPVVLKTGLSVRAIASLVSAGSVGPRLDARRQRQDNPIIVPSSLSGSAATVTRVPRLASVARLSLSIEA